MQFLGATYESQKFSRKKCNHQKGRRQDREKHREKKLKDRARERRREREEEREGGRKEGNMTLLSLGKWESLLSGTIIPLIELKECLVQCEMTWIDALAPWQKLSFQPWKGARLTMTPLLNSDKIVSTLSRAHSSVISTKGRGLPLLPGQFEFENFSANIVSLTVQGSSCLVRVISQGPSS